MPVAGASDERVPGFRLSPQRWGGRGRRRDQRLVLDRAGIGVRRPGSFTSFGFFRRNFVAGEAEEAVAAGGLGGAIFGIVAVIFRLDHRLLFRREGALVTILAELALLLAVEAGRGREAGPPDPVIVLPDLVAGEFGTHGLRRRRRFQALFERVHVRLPIVADGAARFVVPGEQGLGLAVEVDEQAVVEDPLLGDELAAIIAAPDCALDRPLPGDGADPARAEESGGLAGLVERAGVGAAADPRDRLLGETDAGRRLASDSAIGERLDIGALPGGGEAVLAVAKRHRLEGEAIGRPGGLEGAGRGEIIGRRLGRWRGARLGAFHEDIRT